MGNAIRRAAVLAAAGALAFASGEALAQVKGDRGVEIEAFAGDPLGVARMSVEIESPYQRLRAEGLVAAIEDEHGRALYPAFETGVVSLAVAKSESTPVRVTAYFLFRGPSTRLARSGPRPESVEGRGDADLALTLRVTQGYFRKTFSAGVKPTRDEAARRRLLGSWWRVYTAAARARRDVECYPPVVESYLTEMLARRLALKEPRYRGKSSWHRDVDKALGLLTGAESIRVAMQKDVLLEGAGEPRPADTPLPQPIMPQAVEIPEPAAGVTIEPIAMHVPAECFYVRFGSFANFQWLRSNIDDWGSKVRDLASFRGVNYGIRQKLERQIALKETALARLVGGAVISDVAAIGMDPFVREGAALGILFEARNGKILGAEIALQREQARAADKTIAKQDVDIAGRTVSFLSTPDNSVRSFYAVDGDYHLVATSRELVRRLFEAGAGKRALGATKEFRYARTKMPLDRDPSTRPARSGSRPEVLEGRDDTAFVYLSDAFFRKLVGPHYRVEMTRRMKALAEIELTHLARLAADAEGESSEALDDLTDAGFLPANFGRRPDGRRIEIVGGQVLDSLRGARGTFLPVADVKVTRVTQAEARSYRRFAVSYRAEWEWMDPAIIAMRRDETPDGEAERITIDLMVYPYARRKYATIAGFLGAATGKRMAPVEGDLASADVVAGLAAKQRFFAGVRDSRLRFAIKNGEPVPADRAERDLKAYFGEIVGEHGSSLFGLRTGEADAEGYLKVRDDHWTRRFGGFAAAAFTKDVLEAVTPQLELVDAERKAQARLHVGDLSHTDLATPLNALAYLHAYKISEGNAQFLHVLSRQFKAKPEQCLALAGRLLGGTVICPLGGTYRLSGARDGRVWRSNRARVPLREVKRVPKSYRFPLLDMVRGLDLEFMISDTTLSTHMEVEMRTKGKAAP